MKATGQSFKAQNGDIITLSVDDVESVFVFEEDDYEDDKTKVIDFLWSVKNHFFDYNNKWSQEPTEVTMFLSPGREARVHGHVKAFLKNMMFEPSEDLILAVTTLIEESNEY